MLNKVSTSDSAHTHTNINLNQLFQEIKFVIAGYKL